MSPGRPWFLCDELIKLLDSSRKIPLFGKQLTSQHKGRKIVGSLFQDLRNQLFSVIEISPVQVESGHGMSDLDIFGFNFEIASDNIKYYLVLSGFYSATGQKEKVASPDW